MTFTVLIADPPWKFKTWSKKGLGKSPKYPTMDFEDIASMPVKKILAKNAVIFLWVTWPMIQQGLALLPRWGFSYRTLGFEWVKMGKNGNPTLSTGYYTRATCEPCLIGVRGSMPVVDRGVPDVILAPPGFHSEKPEQVYEQIERLYPREQFPDRLELFASTHSIPKAQRWGYHPMGYDVDGRDIRHSLLDFLGEQERLTI